MTSAAATAGATAAGSRLRTPRGHVLVMSLLFSAALGVGYVMLPGASERVAMLEKDGQNRLALRLLEQRYGHGDRRQRTLYQLHRLYENFGDMVNARRVLEQLVEQRPRDINLNRQLAQLYKQLQEEPAYVAQVRRNLRLRYDKASCREVIGLFRRSGNHAEELRQIEECRVLGYDDDDDAIRLGHLLAAEGNVEEATAIFRQLDDRRKLVAPREKLTLFAALLDINQPKEAYRRGLRWYRSQADEELALSMIDFMAGDDWHDLAMDFTRSLGAPGDAITLAMGELMLDRQQVVAAKSFLRSWLDRAQLDNTDLATRFIAAAIAAEDPELAFIGAQRFGLQRLSQADLVVLAETLGGAGRNADFDAVRAYLTAETLAENPLAAAAAAVASGHREGVLQQLRGIDVRDLEDYRLALWASLMRKFGQSSAALATMREVGVEPDQRAPRVARTLRGVKKVRRRR